MEDQMSFDWTRFRLAIKEAIYTLPHFLKNPVDGIRNLPDWDWPTLFTLQGSLAMLCGFLKDILQHKVIAAVVWFFVAPIVAGVMSIVISGFFYYTFMFAFHRQVEFRKVFTHVLFASIPVLLIWIVTPFVPLIGLVGVAAAASLLVVGFTANFQLPLRKVQKLVFGVFLIYAASLIVQMISWRDGKESLRLKATPESLDILEKELKEDSTN
jgi:hypothetical protein